MTKLFRDRWMLIAGLFCLVMAAALFLSPYVVDLPNPVKTNLGNRLAPPTLSLFGLGEHPLGTDQLGRDILSRIASGGHVTFYVTLPAVLVGALLGGLAGVLCGYAGGATDRVVSRLIDIQQSIPTILLAVLIVAVLGASLSNLVMVLALTSWVRHARVIRSKAMVLGKLEFITAGHAIGASHVRLVFLHIIPNILGVALVITTLEFARIVVLEAGLSFIGLGIQPPAPSLGRMLADGRAYADTGWWLITFPGIAIAVLVLGFNLTGDWLRDWLDPRHGG